MEKVTKFVILIVAVVVIIQTAKSIKRSAKINIRRSVYIDR